MPTGHNTVFTLNRLLHEGNDCLAFSSLLRTHSIYTIYNSFYICRASCVPKNKKPPKPQINTTPQSPQTLRRFIGSWGPADSLLSPERGHFLGDGWQEPTKNSQPLGLWQWREFKACIFKTERSLLNNALPREMSSQLDDSVQSTPKMCWMLQYTTSMVIP